MKRLLQILRLLVCGAMVLHVPALRATIFDDIGDFFEDIGEDFEDAFGKEAWEAFGDEFVGAMKKVGQEFEEFGHEAGIVAFGEGMADFGTNIGEAAVSFAEGLVDMHGGLFTGDLDRAAEGLTSMTLGTTANLTESMAGWASAFGKIGGSWNLIGGVLDGASNVWKGIAKGSRKLAAGEVGATLGAILGGVIEGTATASAGTLRRLSDRMTGGPLKALPGIGEYMHYTTPLGALSAGYNATLDWDWGDGNFAKDILLRGGPYVAIRAIMGAGSKGEEAEDFREAAALAQELATTLPKLTVITDEGSFPLLYPPQFLAAVLPNLFELWGPGELQQNRKPGTLMTMSAKPDVQGLAVVQTQKGVTRVLPDQMLNPYASANLISHVLATGETHVTTSGGQTKTLWLGSPITKMFCMQVVDAPTRGLKSIECADLFDFNVGQFEGITQAKMIEKPSTAFDGLQGLSFTGGPAEPVRQEPIGPTVRLKVGDEIIRDSLEEIYKALDQLLNKVGPAGQPVSDAWAEIAGKGLIFAAEPKKGIRGAMLLKIQDPSVPFQLLPDPLETNYQPLKWLEYVPDTDKPSEGILTLARGNEQESVRIPAIEGYYCMAIADDAEGPYLMLDPLCAAYTIGLTPAAPTLPGGAP